jgi:kynurenine formamidase
MFERISNWGRWGADDERGTLNEITPDKVREAALLVEDGLVVSCGGIDTRPSPSNLAPPQHHMLMTGDSAAEGYGQARDFIGIAPHGPATTHLDALCHVFYDGVMYNGRPSSLIKSSGAEANAIDAIRDGVVTRGILLDLSAIGGSDYLTPERLITPADLDAAERAAGVQVGPGDALLIRVGRHRRVEVEGPEVERKDGRTRMAGLDVGCLPWLKERDVALLGSDAAHDALPSGYTRPSAPIHIGALVYLGLHLLDNGRFDRLAEACRARDRWEFLFSIAPLPIARGTGSPVNPQAIF